VSLCAVIGIPTVGAPERFESGVRLAPVIFLGEPILADLTGGPNATQPEPFTVSSPLLTAASGELASHMWDLAE
jgi:hypothetical protein